MADFTIGQNDLLPIISAVLTNESGTPVNLTGATVSFHMSAANGTPKVNEAAVIDSPAAGTVHYDWAVGDTDEAGLFDAEWEVIFTTGTKPLTFPNTATKISVQVTEELA